MLVYLWSVLYVTNLWRWFTYGPYAMLHIYDGGLLTVRIVCYKFMMLVYLWSVSCCMLQIYDGGLLMDDLLSVATSHRHIHQYAGPPCPSEGNPCLNNGHCMPDLNNYYCICEEGFYGVNCESGQVIVSTQKTCRPLGYERVYLPLYKVADTPFHIHGCR